jgi:beta-galactosidase
MSVQRPSARAVSTGALGAPRLESTGLRLGRDIVPLWCGAVHYFRVPRSRWRRALESVRALGLPIVETYVPWATHEREDGSFDFGDSNPQNDLGAFLDLAHELGLYVFLRPGPNVNAELPLFGLPRRIVLEPSHQARSSRGRVLPFIAPPRMFPVPSYASRSLRAEVGKWFNAVGAVAASRSWPRGPIVLLQVDNETAFFFRDGPYDSDYHPDAVADFARFLELRYGTIIELNAVYGTGYERFDQVVPPHRFRAASKQELPAHLDWMAFHETLLCGALASMSHQLVTAGLELPTVHNLPMGEGGLPTPISTLGRSLDLVGLDYYHGQSGLGAARRRTLRLAGSSHLPFAPELGVGAPPWFGSRSELDSLLSAVTACAYGLRGFNLYMAVDRDRWFGAPLDNDGEPRPSAEPWRKLLAALQRVGFHRLKRRIEVAVCIPKEYAQLTRATHTLGALSPSLLDLAGVGSSAACRFDGFGFEQPVQLAWQALLARLDEALCSEQVPFVYVESDADFDAIEGLRAVITPSYEFADPARWQRLQRFASAGGTVLWGPRLPSLDASMRPCHFEPLGRAAFDVDDHTEARGMIRALADELDLARPMPVEPWPVQTTVHCDEHGPRVLFVFHPGGEDVAAEIHLQAPMRLADALSAERFAGTESLTIPMAAQSCRMLIVEREHDAH